MKKDFFGTHNRKKSSKKSELDFDLGVDKAMKTVLVGAVAIPVISAGINLLHDA